MQRGCLAQVSVVKLRLENKNDFEKEAMAGFPKKKEKQLMYLQWSGLSMIFYTRTDHTIFKE